MATAFKLEISAFSVIWLRAYDFGLEEQHLVGARNQIVEELNQCSFVRSFQYLDDPTRIDEIDGRMFDVRYQERSRLVRIYFHPFQLADQDLGKGVPRSAVLRASLLLDLASGFGVFDVCLPHTEGPEQSVFAIEEIGCLARQWLLAQDERGNPQRLALRLPISGRAVKLYVREIMNYFFLQMHNLLWRAAKSTFPILKQEVPDFGYYLKASLENDPGGCPALRKLNEWGLTRSLFPTTFGPVIDIWGIAGMDPIRFDSGTFLTRYDPEVAWIFTDGQRTTLGEFVENQRNTKSLALYIWPNHALYINQDLKAIAPERVRQRVEGYGCLDVEIIRILEIISLQSAFLRAFDRFLDQQLEQVSTLAARDHSIVIRLTQERRKMSHSTRSFDFYNLFHTAYWEPLYARLLEHPHLRLRDASTLVDLKLTRLDEEIQQAIIIEDRTRQQQQRQQELDVLRGLHSLGLANELQSKALVTINFLVSATASFSFTQVLIPALTRLTGAQPSFPDAYPLAWILMNVGVFALVAWSLNKVSLSITQRQNPAVELEGQLDLPLDHTQLQKYSMHYPGLAYLHLNAFDQSGYLRVQKPEGLVVFEFDRNRIYRYSLLLQGHKDLDLARVERSCVDREVESLRAHQVIVSPSQADLTRTTG